MALAIEYTQIYKSYQQVKAVRDINLSVQAGELFGLIGADGAGKTTLMRMLVSLLLPDSGSLKALGIDVVKDFKKIRQKLGYMPGRFSLYQDLSVIENLEFFAGIFGNKVTDNYDMIKSVYEQIEPFKHRRAGALSGGMKQKLALSCALVHRPELLVLDEPTTGVDAVSRTEFWQMLTELKNSGITVFVSTPYMDEAMLCSRVALIQGGGIMQVDTPQGIIKAMQRRVFEISHPEIYKLLLCLRAMPEMHSAQPFGQVVHFLPKNNHSIVIENLQEILVAEGFTGVSIRNIEPDIEDCFMELMIQQNTLSE